MVKFSQLRTLQAGLSEVITDLEAQDNPPGLLAAFCDTEAHIQAKIDELDQAAIEAVIRRRLQEDSTLCWNEVEKQVKR